MRTRRGCQDGAKKKKKKYEDSEMERDKEEGLDYSLVNSDEDDDIMESIEEKKKRNNKEDGRNGRGFIMEKNMSKNQVAQCNFRT